MLHDEYVVNRIARDPKFLVALGRAARELADERDAEIAEGVTDNTTPYWVAYSEAPLSMDILTHTSTIVYRMDDAAAGDALRPEQV